MVTSSSASSFSYYFPPPLSKVLGNLPKYNRAFVSQRIVMMTFFCLYKCLPAYLP